jgi:hypothetical protein
MSDKKEVVYSNYFDAFTDGCDIVLKNLDEFMVEMDQKEGFYEEKYDKVKRMVIGMRASLGNPVEPEEQSAIEVPSQQIILPS